MIEAKWVYFIKPVGAEGPIKIGCSVLPEERMASIMVWSPAPLEIIGKVPGTYADEQMVHGKFAAQHSHCEWFHASAELTGAIATAMATGSLDHIAAMPGSGSIRKGRRKSISDDRRRYLSYSARVRIARDRLRSKGIEAWADPEDVAAIIRRWDHGGFYRNRTPGITPKPEEIARLEEYLADPAAHSVVPKWLRRAA